MRTQPLPQRRHRRAMGPDRAPHPRVPRRAPPQDRHAGRRRRHPLHPPHRLPVALPAQGLPAQEHRLAVLRRVAAQRLMFFSLCSFVFSSPYARSSSLRWSLSIICAATIELGRVLGHTCFVSELLYGGAAHGELRGLSRWRRSSRSSWCARSRSSSCTARAASASVARADRSSSSASSRSTRAARSTS